MSLPLSGDVDAAASTLDRWIEDHREELIALRRDIHAHPELSDEEHRTTALVSERLTPSYEIRRISRGTGVICDLPSSESGRSRLAVRADMDALAMHDLKSVEYRSTIDGVSHACGHDVHTTIGVGVAMFFADHPELAGRNLRFIFQPAEEMVPGGAVDVVRDGGLDGVDAVVALHCQPKLPVGTIGLRTGPMTSAADMLTVRLIGPGGHTARPELTVDTVALAARVITEVPKLVSAAADGAEVKVVFGSVHGGDAANVIPTHCELKASVRTPSATAWDSLEDIVRYAIATVVEPTGATCELEYTRGVPPTVNDGAVVEQLRTAAVMVAGAEHVVEAEQSWGGDDFAWLTRAAPGAYVRLGVHDTESGREQLDLHAGHFDVDERAIEVGVRLLATLAMSSAGVSAD